MYNQENQESRMEKKKKKKEVKNEKQNGKKKFLLLLLLSFFLSFLPQTWKMNYEFITLFNLIDQSRKKENNYKVNESCKLATCTDGSFFFFSFFLFSSSFSGIKNQE